jgi:hypothetical protein
MITEIKIGPEMVLHIEEPMYSDSIVIAGCVAQAPAIDSIIRKLYFKVDNGPKILGYPGIENYSPEAAEDLQKPSNHITWRLAQHERRLWQAGGQPFVGVDHPEYQHETELTPEQNQIISKYFF